MTFGFNIVNPNNCFFPIEVEPLGEYSNMSQHYFLAMNGAIAVPNNPGKLELLT